MPLKINEFYGDEKTIQKSYDFVVNIVNDNSKGYLPAGDPMPEIKDWHVKDITLPNYEFKKEVQFHGPFPYSFPVLEHDGFEFTITFEEDNVGTIANLIDWLQRRIITKDGKYVPPNTNKLTGIVCDVFKYEKKKRVKINTIYFTNCYFLRVSSLSFDYATNESIKREVTFGADFIYVNKNPGVIDIN